MFDSIRVRLTFWHFIIFAVLQAVLAVSVYAYITQELAREMDSILTRVLDSTAVAIALPASHTPEGALDANRALSTVHHIETPIVIYGVAGQPLAERPETVSRLTPLILQPEISFYTILPAQPLLHRGDRRYAVRRVHDTISRQDFFVAASISLSTYQDVLRTARHAFLLGTPCMLFLTVALGWRLTGRSLAPAVLMAERARSIGVEDMAERLTVQNPGNEFGRLAIALNDLLDRLAMKSQLQRQFMADAAHEIRTPLSIIQTAVSVGLLNPETTPADLLETLRVVDDYAQRLTRSVNDVFRLARSDAGFPCLNIQNLYLDEILFEVVRAARLLASAKDIRLHLAPTSSSPMRGDEALLHELFLNLLDNAVKYTRERGSVHVSLRASANRYDILVADSGPGIAVADHERIFQRFCRGTPVTGQVTEGTGLGLPIARWIAELHHGSLQLTASTVTGSTFTVRLPSSAEP